MMSTTATTAMGGGVRNSNKFPFTATQWEELEHQALIYKYMTAGVPIPPDLLFTIKRSLESSSLSSSKFIFPNYHLSSPLGWNAYNQIHQMGYGKKIDPEPGRCRRTDGKKWRCSKEAYPDSKYCERHMHRGKNRSRKPVEIINPNFTNNTHSNSTSNNNSNSVTIASSSITANSSCSPYSASLTHQSVISTSTSTTPKIQPTFSLHSLSSLPSSDSPYSSLYSHPYYNHKDYSSRERDNYQGLKEEVGEHAFFTDSSSSVSSMRSAIDDQNWQQQMKQQEKECNIWGRDHFNCDLSMRVEEERENNDNDKTTLHFFDEWPLKPSGVGGGGGGGNRGEREYSSLWNESPSTTQLSISIPTSSASHHHDFFLSNSRTHHHDG